jgi:hypothetical protein
MPQKWFKNVNVSDDPWSFSWSKQWRYTLLDAPKVGRGFNPPFHGRKMADSIKMIWNFRVEIYKDCPNENPLKKIASYRYSIRLSYNAFHNDPNKRGNWYLGGSIRDNVDVGAPE